MVDVQDEDDEAKSRLYWKQETQKEMKKVNDSQF